MLGGTMDPDEVKVPKAPYDWVDPDPKKSKGEPTFEKLDNLGECISFSYHPVFLPVSQGGQ